MSIKNCIITRKLKAKQKNFEKATDTQSVSDLLNTIVELMLYCIEFCKACTGSTLDRSDYTCKIHVKKCFVL